MSANIPSAGDVRQLDLRSESVDQVTERDVEDVGRMSRLLMGILRDVSALKRRWSPNRLDFEDRTVDATGTTKYRFEHRFGARVRWWVVGWSGAAASALSEHTDTDYNTLVLTSASAGTATIRIEEAG